MNSKRDKEFILVTERFHPDTTSSTGQYMTDLAIGLQERGLDMTVYTRKVTGSNSDTSDVKPNQVTINRVPIPEVPQNTFAGRLLNWITFLIVVVPLLLISRSEKTREVIFVTYPTILPPILWLVCRLRGWEYTYIIYDYYPECAVQFGYIQRGGLVHKGWKQLNRLLLDEAKNIVALGPVMRERIVESAADDFDCDKVSIIHNWADGDFIKPRKKEENWFSQKHGLVEPFTLVYSGNTGKYHDVETVIKGVTELDKGGIKLLVIGEGDNKENLINLAETLNVKGESVTFLPYQPWEVVPYSFTSGDISIVAVNAGFAGLCVSSKLYSALAAGQPVLVVSEEQDDEAQIVKKFDAGKQVSPGDTDAVVDAINCWKRNPELVQEQGQNAREAFTENFTERESVDKYYDMLTS